MNLGIGLSICRPQIASGGAAWSPTDLASLDAWWKISDDSTITKVSDTTASAVADQSGNGRNLVQTAIPGDQPALYGTIGTNSIHALTFSGGTDFMSVSRTLAQPFTIASIAQATAVGTNTIQALLSFGAGAGDEFAIWNDDQYRLDAGSGQLLGTADNNAHVLLAEFNGASSRLYVDGTLIGTVNAGADGATIYRLGSRANGFLGWRGTISDTLICSAVLSSGDRASLTTYLGNLAGITVS